MTKAIFLDRDGVVNRNTHYVNKWSDFEILPNVHDAIKLLKAAGFKIFVVTNQGGVEKGYILESELIRIHQGLKNAIPEILDIRYCTSYESFDRKPNPGMIYDLAYDNEIYLNESWMIGDSITDCIAGRRAGCKTIYIMNNIVESMKANGDPHINAFSTDLMEATKYILIQEGFSL
jgi:D-glycero-D-manno-heptose 1,7-bisphosphate phosphatase